MATHHVRHPSHHSRKAVPAHARPSKLDLSLKRSLPSGKGNHKLAHRKEAENEGDDDDSDDTMAVSFLNYCAVCEKQIIVPSNAVLYCSQSCRKKDTGKSLLELYGFYSPPTTPFINLSFEDLAFRDIVPQRSPTQPESRHSSRASSVISSDDNFPLNDEKTYRPDSEATRYLRQFQSSTSSVTETTRSLRPRYNWASTSQISFGTLPSLSHTPMSSGGLSLPYTPSTTRPLPPRNKPHSSSYISKSIDLVTPLTAPSSPKQFSHKTPPISKTSTSTIEGEIVYAKSPVPTVSATNGSLSRLMASTPR